jgi:hypothetical protein
MPKAEIFTRIITAGSPTWIKIFNWNWPVRISNNDKEKDYPARITLPGILFFILVHNSDNDL